MKWIILILLLVGVYVYWTQHKKRQSSELKIAKEEQNRKDATEPLPIAGAYQKRWLLTYNEKDAYKKLQVITDGFDGYLFAKVRLLDLLEPVSGNKKYKTYFYKIQSKHVDFVICDSKLVARCIVELDDNSHTALNRQERDAFVDEVVKSVGYTIIHTHGITADIEKQIRACFV